jgi:hypothetical protein
MEMKNQDPSVWTATQMTEKTNKKQKNKGVIGKLKSGLMTKQIEHLHLAQIAHSSQNTLINLIIYSEASVWRLTTITHP